MKKRGAGERESGRKGAGINGEWETTAAKAATYRGKTDDGK